MALTTPASFSSSVGTKILIGITGFALFLYLLIHIAGNLMVFFGPAVFNRYAYTLEEQSAAAGHRAGAAVWSSSIHIYKTVRMFLGNQSARPVALREEEARRPHQPQDVRLVDDDRLGPVAARVPRHPRQGVPRSGTEYEWPAGGRDLYRQEMENLPNPLIVGFYVLSMIVVGSHLWHGISSAFQSLGLDQPAMDAAFMLPAGKVIAVADRRRLHRHRAVGALLRECRS